MKFRPRHNEADQEKYGELTALDFSNDPGRTLKEPAQDADINVLMARMGVKDGSQLPHFTSPRALYGDFSGLSDDPVEFAQAIHDGNIAFMKLPAKIRQRFENAEELFQWMSDNDNYDEAVRLGLLERPKTPAPGPVSSSTSSDKEPLVPSSTTSTTDGK